LVLLGFIEIETYEAMKANGVTFKGEPNTMQWGTFVQFNDETVMSFY
jgi:hypothetical protein